MEDREKRPMSASLSIKDRQVYPQDTNHHHTMFGGLLMANIDEIAAICAMKHSSAHYYVSLHKLQQFHQY